MYVCVCVCVCVIYVFLHFFIHSDVLHTTLNSFGDFSFGFGWSRYRTEERIKLLIVNWKVILKKVIILHFRNRSFVPADKHKTVKIQFYDSTVLLHLFLISPSPHASRKCVSQQNCIKAKICLPGGDGSVVLQTPGLCERSPPDIHQIWHWYFHRAWQGCS